ncbi:MAG: OmpA family protein [Flavobacteriales bacterium]|nr:OmpA family protein [Flavobacteriales bacterium]
MNLPMFEALPARRILTALFSFLMLSVAVPALAQSDATEDADAMFERGGYFDAAAEYQSAYGKLKGDLEEKGRVCFQIGECYRSARALAASEEWYKKSIDLKWAKDHVEVFLNYGLVLMGQQKYDKATAMFDRYTKAGGDRGLAGTLVENCGIAAENMVVSDSRYRVESISMLNSPSFDYGAVYSDRRADEVIFSSSRSSAAGSGEDPITGESFMDLFSAEVDRKGKWSIPQPLNSTINSTSNEGGVALDKKKQTLYFTRCLVDKDNNYPCDIYLARRLGKKWGAAEELGLVDRASNDSCQVGQPALSPSDDFMIFVSDMAGGQGGNDLYYALYDGDSETWGSVTNLGSDVNSPDDEMFPHIRSNGDLYFASNRDGGMGGLDIYHAAWTGSDMEFNSPSAMEFPINTSSDDFGIVFHPEEERGMFTSDRPESKGKDDLFEFTKPPLEFNYLPLVYDYDTGMPIEGVRVMVTGTDGGSAEGLTDDEGAIENGGWEISPESTYAVEISKEGYIAAGDQFSTIGLSKSTQFIKEYLLQVVVTEKDYPMPLVQYVFDEATLVVDAEVNSHDSLTYLVDLLTRNPTFVISLEAHTDTRGGDDYNRELSQRRAETCVSFLVERGIDRARLESIGRGEDMPLISDVELAKLGSEEEQEAAHQMNRRTVFRITSFDFVPK